MIKKKLLILVMCSSSHLYEKLENTIKIHGLIIKPMM